MGTPQIPSYCDTCGKPIDPEDNYCRHCSAAPDIKPAACPHCKAAIDARDQFCRRCGKPQDGSRAAWYYKHWGIWAMTCLVGPFSLAAVWRSPVLTKTAKWAYTAAIVAITVWLFLAAKTAFMTGLSAITDSGDLSGITGSY